MRPLIVLVLVLLAGIALTVSLGLFSSSNPGEVAVGPATATNDGAGAPVGPSTLAKPDNRTEEAAPLSVTEVDSAAPELTPEPAGNNSLVGRVLDKDLNPLAGARVSVGPDAMMGEELSTMLVFGTKSKGPRRTTTTNARGEYKFEALSPRRDYYLMASHEEWAPLQRSGVVVGDAGSFSAPDLVLGPGATIHGTITDTTGNAVPGADVFLESAFWGGEGPSPDRLATKTDGNGNYVFRALDKGAPRQLTVAADGYGIQVRTNVGTNFSPEDIEVVDITLDLGQPIGGVVMSDAGVGIEGAIVRAYNHQNNTSFRGQTITQPDGSFLIDFLQPGSYILQVTAPCYRLLKSTRVRTGELDTKVDMIRQASVAGRVVGADGAPVSDFTIEVRRDSPQNLNQNTPPIYEETGIANRFTSQPDGAFEMCGLNPGAYVLLVSAAGHAPTFSGSFTVFENQDVRNINVTLSTGGSIAGVVVSGNGTPIPGAIVTTYDDNWDDDPTDPIFGDLIPSNITKRRVRTDADGRFELSMLTPERYQLRVVHPEFSTGVKRGIQVGKSVNDIGRLTLSAGGTLRGIVRDRAGNLVVGGLVHLESDMGDQVYDTRTDGEGRYEFLHVRPAGYTLSAMSGTPTGPEAVEVILDAQQSRVPVQVTDGGEFTRDLNIGG